MIGAANLRDASYITANLRPIDHAEAFCQLPADFPSWALAQHLLTAPHARIAYDGEVPAVLFGYSLLNVSTASLWAVGTKRMRRAMPEVTTHYSRVIEPELHRLGVLAAEARSLVTHLEAHHWMRAWGGKRHGPAFVYGRGGERFYMFRWTVSPYRAKRRDLRQGIS